MSTRAPAPTRRRCSYRVVVVMLLVAACGTGPAADPTPTSTDLPPPSVGPAPTGPDPTEPETTTTAEPSEPIEIPADFLPVDQVSEQDAVGFDLVVTDVRLGSHPDVGFDRVVFDLEGAEQVGWVAEYQDEPVLAGSGAPVALAGAATLVVRIQGTGIPEDLSVYQPGQLLVPGTGLHTVTEVLRTGPYEGELLAFIGVRDEAPFRVTRLGDPERLVVDIAHHDG